jgi:hypothetical protein
MRKVIANVKVRLVMSLGKNDDENDAIDDLDYKFIAADHATVEDTEIMDTEIIDASAYDAGKKKRVVANLTVKLVITVNEGVAFSDVIDEMDYDFFAAEIHHMVESTEILDYDVVDSR